MFKQVHDEIVCESQEELDATAKRLKEMAFEEAIDGIINQYTIRRGIYLVPRINLRNDLIKFMKENSDEINTIK